MAHEVGVTTPSLYRHFPDKAALVSAVCLQVWTQLGQRMSAAATDHHDPFAALGASGRAYIEFGRDHPVQYRLLLLRPTPEAHSREQAEAAAECFRQVVEATDRCVTAGVLQGDPGTIALTLWASAHGCVSLLISSPPFPGPADVDAFIELTMRSTGLGAGLATRLPPGDIAVPTAALTPTLDAWSEQLMAAGAVKQK